MLFVQNVDVSLTIGIGEIVAYNVEDVGNSRICLLICECKLTFQRVSQLRRNENGQSIQVLNMWGIPCYATTEQKLFTSQPQVLPIFAEGFGRPRPGAVAKEVR